METSKFSINDWVIKTQLLTLAERGMLKDLIDQVVYFEVALSAAKVQTIRERLTKEEGASLNYLLDQFFVEENGAYFLSDRALKIVRIKPNPSFCRGV